MRHGALAIGDVGPPSGLHGGDRDHSRRAYYDELPERPVTFRANMLRSASGRAYLAYCPEREREAVLRRLRERETAGHQLAHDPDAIRRIIETTRRRGYSVRAADFGGD